MYNGHTRYRAALRLVRRWEGKVIAKERSEKAVEARRMRVVREVGGAIDSECALWRQRKRATALVRCAAAFLVARCGPRELPLCQRAGGRVFMQRVR